MYKKVFDLYLILIHAETVDIFNTFQEEGFHGIFEDVKSQYVFTQNQIMENESFQHTQEQYHIE